MSRFQKATKTKARLRMALVGPSGSGKTYTALGLATRLAGKTGRIAFLDSERGSASKYADIFDFDVVDMDTFSPRTYIELIQEADSAGYDVIVIDSLSHAWMGAGGALEMVDKVSARSKSANSFAAWREVTPEHNALVDAILACRCHVIATMRVKTEWVMEDVNGKKVPRRIGTQPVQRDGLEYEFDVVADLDHENYFTVSKTRCPSLKDHRSRHSTAEIGEMLIGWLEDGVDAPVPAADGGTRSKYAAALLDIVGSAETNSDLDAALKQLVVAKKAGRLTAAEYGTVVEAGRAKRMTIAKPTRLDAMREQLTGDEEQAAAIDSGN